MISKNQKLQFNEVSKFIYRNSQFILKSAVCTKSVPIDCVINKVISGYNYTLLIHNFQMHIFRIM